MVYRLFISSSCKKDMNKACSKKRTSKAALGKKITEILSNPLHCKPLINDLSGMRRVYIIPSTRPNSVSTFESLHDTYGVFLCSRSFSVGRKWSFQIIKNISEQRNEWRNVLLYGVPYDYQIHTKIRVN